MDSKTQTPKTYSPKRKWAVLAATLPARFVINGLAWASFTLLLSSICQEMGWSDAQRTVLSSAYQIGQIIAMVSIGFLLDKLSVKKLFAFGVILLLTLAGCAAPAEPAPTRTPSAVPSTELTPSPACDVTADPPLSESSLNAAVPDFLEEDQQLLYRRAHCAYNHLFGASTEDFDYWTEGDDHYFYAAGDLEMNGISYARCRGRYSNWEDFDAMVRSIFTDGCWTALNGDRYVNVDGTLYFAYGDRGSYYNRRFPDTFTLISKTDDEIVFTLTGHYSSPWPNEGESFEDRDRRLESGWDYTYDFPIRMVRTEDGWRFDTFHAAQADAVDPETAAEAALPLITPVPDTSASFPLALHPASPIGVSSDCQYYALREDGTLLMWGQAEEYNGIGLCKEYSYQEPLEVAHDVAAIYPGMHMFLYTDTEGTLWGISSPVPDGADTIELPSSSLPVVRLLEDVVWADQCITFGYALQSDGTLWGWGDGLLIPGEYGRKDAGMTKLMDGVIWVWGSFFDGCLITADHTLYVWDDTSASLQAVCDHVRWAAGGHLITLDNRLYRFYKAEGDPRGNYQLDLLLTDVKREVSGLPHALGVIRTDDSLWVMERLYHEDGTGTLAPAEKLMEDVADADTTYLRTMILKTDGTVLLYENDYDRHRFCKEDYDEPCDTGIVCRMRPESTPVPGAGQPSAAPAAPQPVPAAEEDDSVSDGVVTVTAVGPAVEGAYSEFLLSYQGQTRTFSGHSLDWNWGSVFTEDLTGDGIPDVGVRLVFDRGTGRCREELHLFDGSDLTEIPCASLEERLTAMVSSTLEDRVLTIDTGRYQIVFPPDAAADNGEPFEHAAAVGDFYRFYAEDGKLYCEMLCQTSPTQNCGSLVFELNLNQGNFYCRSVGFCGFGHHIRQQL